MTDTALMASSPHEDAYLPVKPLAIYSGLSVRTLRSYFNHPTRPLPFYRVGGKILVRRSEFNAWVQQFRKVQNAAEFDSVVGDIANAFLR
jgi:hypothetical protein